jgi:gliding motility-associatede transport system auxiliary component
MNRQKVNELGLYALYAGVALVVVAALIGLFQHGSMSTPVFIGLIVGLVLVVFAFFTSSGLSGRHVKYGTNMILMTGLLAVILVAGYILMERYPYRFDMTKEKLFTLSDQTVKILEELKEPVRAIAFMTPGQSEEFTSVQELLRSYERHSQNFKFEAVDPYVDPIRARDLKVQELGTVVFLAGEQAVEPSAQPTPGAGGAAKAAGAEQKRYSVSKNDYMEFDYSGAQMGQQPTSRFKGEQAFTTALLRVTGGEKKKVYFLAGHEENPIDSQDETGLSGFKDALESEGFASEKLYLTKTQQVPKDASLLVIAGPKRPLLPVEAQLLVNYVKGGGKALLLPNIVPSPTLNEVLEPFHLEIGNDVVIDPQSRHPLSPFVTVATTYQFHEITEKITEYTIFPAAHSITVKGDAHPWTVTPLIKTTEAAWAETNFQHPRYDKGVDKPGPIDLAVVLEGAAADVPAEIPPQGAGPHFGFGEVEMPSSDSAPTPVPTVPAAGGGQGGGNAAEMPTPVATPAAVAATPAALTAEKKTTRWSDQTRLAVIASSELITNNNLFGFLQGGNRDLVMNTVNWLVGKKELISIRAKDTHLPQLTMTENEFDLVFWITVVLVPALVLLVGVAVWYQRR